MQIITTLLLKEKGFVPTGGDKNIFSKRIHDKIYIEFDLNDNFITLVRFYEFKKVNKDREKIIFPHKVDTIEKLHKVVDFFDGNF